MMKQMLIVGALVLGISQPAFAQGVLGKLGKAASKAKGMADQLKDLVVTEQEEHDMGAAISARLREKYGVVQSVPVHKYVSLVGKSLTASSTRPGLTWTFI